METKPIKYKPMKNKEADLESIIGKSQEVIVFFFPFKFVLCTFFILTFVISFIGVSRNDKTITGS